MKAFFLLPLAFLTALGGGYAQCFRVGEVNAEKPEGQLLQQIGQEPDEAKKLALMEKFAAEYPKHEAAGWVYEQMQARTSRPTTRTKRSRRARRSPPFARCVELMHQTLKAAEAKKDADLIRKWSAQTSQAALKAVGAPKPAEEDEVENWKKRVDCARQVNTYYRILALRRRAAEPGPEEEDRAGRSARTAQPQERVPAAGHSQWFLAYRQAGANDKAVALAEKVLAGGPADEDMLLVVAGDYMQKKKDPEKVHAYAAKIVEIMAAKPKPEGVAEADWQKRKSTLAGRWRTT